MKGVPGAWFGRRHLGGTLPAATAAVIQPTRPRPPPEQAAAAICAHTATGAPRSVPQSSIASARAEVPLDTRRRRSRPQTSLPVVATNLTARDKCNSHTLAVEDDAAGGVYAPPR